MATFSGTGSRIVRNGYHRDALSGVQKKRAALVAGVVAQSGAGHHERAIGKGYKGKKTYVYYRGCGASAPRKVQKS